MGLIGWLLVGLIAILSGPFNRGFESAAGFYERGLLVNLGANNDVTIASRPNGVENHGIPAKG